VGNKLKLLTSGDEFYFNIKRDCNNVLRRREKPLFETITSVNSATDAGKAGAVSIGPKTVDGTAYEWVISFDRAPRKINGKDNLSELKQGDVIYFSIDDLDTTARNDIEGYYSVFKASATDVILFESIGVLARHATGTTTIKYTKEDIKQQHLGAEVRIENANSVTGREVTVDHHGNKITFATAVTGVGLLQTGDTFFFSVSDDNRADGYYTVQSASSDGTSITVVEDIPAEASLAAHATGMSVLVANTYDGYATVHSARESGDNVELVVEEDLGAVAHLVKSLSTGLATFQVNKWTRLNVDHSATIRTSVSSTDKKTHCERRHCRHQKN
jgi:hypothetical protein